MTTVLVRCDNCGAEPRFDATLTTLLVDLTTDRVTVQYACPLCGATSTRDIIDPHIQDVLLDAGCQLAAWEG